MKLFKKLATAMFVLFISTSTFASDDASYQGYYVSSIIHNTRSLFENRNLLGRNLSPFTISTASTQVWGNYEETALRQEQQGMLPIFPFFDFEESFINYCMEKNFITRKQAEKAISVSQHSGGQVANGYNLVILHAGILNALVDNKRITLKEAQDLLDSSREKS